MKPAQRLFAVLLVNFLIITNALNIPPSDADNREPPKIIEGPSNAVVLLKSPIILKCRASGNPKPNISWEVDGSNIIPDRFKTLPSGDLQIDEAIFLGSIEFSCNATNAYGTVKASARVDVKRRTRIFMNEHSQKVGAGERALLRCSPTYDDGLSVEIEWLKDGKPIDYEKQDRYSKLYDDSLAISKTIGTDSGEYTCVARTVLDEDRQNLTLVVEDVPNAPIITDVICDGLRAEIIWKPQGDNHSPILSYAVLYNTSFTPEKWEIGQGRVFSSNLRYSYFMNPGASYSFKVIGENKKGASPPSEHSKTCTTQPDVPFKNPENVRTESTDSTKLIITWSPMPEIEHGGSKLHYRVFWKRDIPNTDWQFKDIFDWQENKVAVDDQPTFVKYLVKVVAINEMGESKVPAEEVIGYSGEDRPLLAPTNFKVVDVQSSTSAILQWDPVSPESLRGHFKGYKLQTWTADDGEDQLQEVRIDNGKDKVLLHVLKPYSKNFVRLCAYNSRFDGPSTVISFDTPEGFPSPVENLEAYAVSPSAILLSWDKPSKPNGRLIGYRIYYEMIRGVYLGVRQESQIITDPSVTSAKLTYLEPDTKYRIIVVARTSVGDGKEFFIERKTLRPNRRPIEPSEPNFKWEPLTSIKVTWQPFNGDPTGTHFFTQYRVKGQKEWLDMPEEKEESFQIVRELSRDTVYEFRVVSVDGYLKKESKIQEIKIY